MAGLYFIAKETLDESSGKSKENLEAWWNENVQKVIKTMKEKKKERDLNRTEETIRS